MADSKLLKLNEEQKKMLVSLQEREERRRLQRDIEKKIGLLEREREDGKRKDGKREEDEDAKTELLTVETAGEMERRYGVPPVVSLAKHPAAGKSSLAKPMIAEPSVLSQKKKKSALTARIYRFTVTGGRHLTTFVPRRGMTFSQFIVFFFFWFTLFFFIGIVVLIGGVVLGHFTLGR